MYKNYIFDLYGTLIDIRTDEWSDEIWENFAKWLGTIGIEYTGEEVHKLYCDLINELECKPSKYTHREIDIISVFEEICRSKKPDMTDEEIWSVGEQFRIMSTSFIDLYPNTMKVLEKLKAAGKNIYLLSNAQRVFTWQELVRTGIDKCFDDIFISSDKGCKKPDIEFYKMLMKKHNLKVEESIMIGNDSTTDIAGATALGMDGLYIKTEISPVNDPLPDCKYAFTDGDIGHVLDIIK